ncbi:MAG: EscU/YscU/HrcU family type III secretion system export apparatus switch protein [Aquificaceae bacterium]
MALKYNPEEADKVPKVLVKGKGSIAERIKEITLKRVRLYNYSKKEVLA